MKKVTRLTWGPGVRPDWLSEGSRIDMLRADSDPIPLTIVAVTDEYVEVEWPDDES